MSVVITFPIAFAEDWKGADDGAEFHLGALTGIGVVDSSGGFAILASGAKKIIRNGFVPDINNSVLIEMELGPMFVSKGTPFFYSTHLRWDFTKDSQWIFFAIGGVAGHITGSGLGSRFLLFPRFGVGALWGVAETFLVRAELSHELIAAGVLFPLY